MFTLALECSTARGSIALGGGPVSWSRDFAAGRGCGGQMFTSLQDALAHVRDGGGRLAEIVVGLGPGSYSGVRQSIAAATGLAAATGAVLRGVPSVAALPVGQEPYHVVGDARRGTFYYTAVSGGQCLVGPELLESADAIAARVAENPGWPVYAVESALPGGLLSGATVYVPSAEHLLAAPPDTRMSLPLEPIYLRPVSITLPKPRASANP